MREQRQYKQIINALSVLKSLGVEYISIKYFSELLSNKYNYSKTDQKKIITILKQVERCNKISIRGDIIYLEV